MSGHSKWSKVKHQKGVTDVVKGRIFTKLANAITIAVRLGGGSQPDMNMRLRFAIENARAANMPKEKIERAIDRGAGAAGEGALEEVVYEGYGPGGIGMVITAATDKRQRTVTMVKNILERGGGVLAASGAVSYLFDYLGEILVEKGNISFDQILEYAVADDAIDAIDRGEVVAIYCLAASLHTMKASLEAQGCTIVQLELVYRPKIEATVSDTDIEQWKKIVEALEDLDDVQRVFSAVKEE